MGVPKQVPKASGSDLWMQRGSVSAQVEASQDGAGPSCVTPQAPSSAAGPQAPLEMNLCWNEIKKKSHSLR